MRPRNLTTTGLAVLLLTSCDGFYESRMVVPPGPMAVSGSVAAVRDYAQINSIPCSDHPGTAIYCHKQPVTLFVLATDGGAEVCYLSRGAQFESRKFASRINALKERLEASQGGSAVVASPPAAPQCFLPDA